ncbi:hypothetical protein ACIA5D_46405 [Actinoplanes sp. NPDC051513]
MGIGIPTDATPAFLGFSTARHILGPCGPDVDCRDRCLTVEPPQALYSEA